MILFTALMIFIAPSAQASGHPEFDSGCADSLSFRTSATIAELDHLIPSLSPKDPNDKVATHIYKNAIDMRLGLAAFQEFQPLTADQICALKAFCRDDGSLDEAVYECD